MLETITTYTTITLWKDLILNLSDGLDGDGDGDYEDGDRQQLADGLLILMATTGGWVTYIDGGGGLHLLRMSSCNPATSSSQLQHIRIELEGTSAVFSGRRDPCIT